MGRDGDQYPDNEQCRARKSGGGGAKAGRGFSAPQNVFRSGEYNRQLITFERSILTQILSLFVFYCLAVFLVVCLDVKPHLRKFSVSRADS